MDLGDVEHLVRLEGGYSGETFLAHVAGERSVVRIYAASAVRRGGDAVDVDAAVLSLVRGLLPVPEVLEVRRADPAGGAPALLVTSFLPGHRLEVVLPGLTKSRRRSLGHAVGRVLARLSGMPMLRAGMLAGADLRVTAMPPGAGDLLDWVERYARGTPLGEWPAADLADLRALAERAQAMLDRLDRACLVHGDFNAKNLLVDPSTGQVTGVVDWEFAHAGWPVTDLGNLLRFERDPEFVEGVLAGYAEWAPAVENLVDLARAADLFALVDLAARRDANPVARRAHDQLLAITRSGDLHAVAEPPLSVVPSEGR